MAETYKIDGTDITRYMSHLQTLDGIIGVPPMIQQDFVVPGRTGVIPAKPWAGPRPVVFGGIVTGVNRIEFQNRFRALGKLCHNGGNVVTITRTLNVTGARTQTAVASARYVSGLEQVDQLSDRSGRVAVEFTLLDGYFYDPDYTADTVTDDATFSITVPGDAPTTKVKVQFSGGTGAQRLTNTTTGDFVEYTGPTATAVELDVADFTAVQGVTNVVSGVRSGTASYYWMRLNPGANVFTRTGNGSVQVFYKAAYL